MILDNLKKQWLALGKKYTKNDLLLHSIWGKIIKQYSEKNRHYHNLNHIQSMLKLAEENKKVLVDLDAVLFSIWFHDVIYKASSKKNEEKSAYFCKDILGKLNLSASKINKITAFIISTKVHKVALTENNDNAFLLDFDLSVLGQSWEVYQTYIQNIRKEYKMYPSFLYNPGRKKVLNNFIAREKLYFTKKYQTLFEAQARRNRSG